MLHVNVDYFASIDRAKPKFQVNNNELPLGNYERNPYC